MYKKWLRQWNSFLTNKQKKVQVCGRFLFRQKENWLLKDFLVGSLQKRQQDAYKKTENRPYIPWATIIDVPKTRVTIKPHIVSYKII